MATALMELGLSGQQLYEDLFEDEIELVVMADNEAAQAIAESGKTKKMKYMNKHQRVRQGFVHDTLYVKQEGRHVERVDTKDNAADWLTKGLDRLDHIKAMDLIGMVALQNYYNYNEERSSWNS